MKRVLIFLTLLLVASFAFGQGQVPPEGWQTASGPLIDNLASNASPIKRKRHYGALKGMKAVGTGTIAGRPQDKAFVDTAIIDGRLKYGYGETNKTGSFDYYLGEDEVQRLPNDFCTRGCPPIYKRGEKLIIVFASDTLITVRHKKKSLQKYGDWDYVLGDDGLFHPKVRKVQYGNGPHKTVYATFGDIEYVTVDGIDQHTLRVKIKHRKKRKK